MSETETDFVCHWWEQMPRSQLETFTKPEPEPRFDVLSEIPIALDVFTQRVNISDTTAWRWRKEGKLKTTNISGRVYIMPDDLRAFNRRAVNGEFAKIHVAPKKQKKMAFKDTSLAK